MSHYELESDIDRVIGEVDVVYQTRIRPERMATLGDLKRYAIDSAVLRKMKPEALILHPLAAYRRTRQVSGSGPAGALLPPGREWSVRTDGIAHDVAGKEINSRIRRCRREDSNPRMKRGLMPTKFMSEEELSTKDFIDLENMYGAHNYHPLDVVIERAEGVWVYDIEGNRYLDCLAAYSAVNQGHCHPKILQALIEQAHKVTLTSRAFRNDQLPMLYKELNELTGYRHGPAHELRGRSGGDCHQDGPKVGIQDQRHSGRQCRDHCLRQQLPWAHNDASKHLHGFSISRRLRSVYPGLQGHSFR